jgi:Protein of unknown function (DUF3592)
MSEKQVNYAGLRFAGFVFGVPLLVLGFFHLAKVSQEKSWPWTMGVVTRSEVSGKQLVLDVPYSNGAAEYVCHQIHYGERPGREDRYRYYEGANTRVYYDPKEPESCVLEPTAGSTFLVFCILGTVMTGCGVYAQSKIRSAQGSETAASPGSVPVSSGDQSSGARRTLENVRELAMAGRTIEAIKAYREITGVGLKEGKDYVDNLVRNV